MIEPRIRCKCTKCGKTQMVTVAAIVSGTAKCWLRSLRTPDCNGELNYYTDDWQDAALNANAVLQYLRNVAFENAKLGELVDTVADDFGTWAEGQQTPQEMGWVDCHGRP